MSEHLAWAQWWAFPWKYAHDDWKGDKHPAIDAFHHNGCSAPASLTGAGNVPALTQL